MISTIKNIAPLIGFVFLFSCGEWQSKSTQITEVKETNFIVSTAITSDTLALSKAFEDLKHNPNFIQEMLLDDGFAEMGEIDEERLFGDLNSDGITDAIIPYMVQNRGEGNNWTIHYAIFLGGEKDLWNYVGRFNSGGSASEYYAVLNKIDNGEISGYHTQYRNSDYRDRDVPVKYIYQNRDLVKTFLKLHKAENSFSDYLYIEEIQTSNNQRIPIIGSLADFHRTLGEKDPEYPEEEPEECGLYYAYEDLAGFVYYPFMTLEINETNEAAVVFIDLKGSGYKIQTNKGTIAEKTHLNEILSIFGDQIEINYSDSDKNRIVDLRIPIEKNSQDVWVLFISKDTATLDSVALLMACH